MRSGLFVALVFILSVTAQAQGLGRIGGVVQDPSTAVIPGAKVTAIQSGTGTRTEVLANGRGEYVFPALPPAGYNIVFTANGFESLTQSGIKLEAD